MRLVNGAFAHPSRKLTSALALPLLALTACGGGSDAGRADDELVIASIFAVSGAATQPTYVNGVKMAVEDINATGGFNGKKIVLKEYDDSLDPQKAISAARLAIKDGADVVIGSPTVSQTNAIADLFKDSGITYINMSSATPVAADESLGGDQTFRMVTAQPEQIYGAVQWILEEKAPKGAGLIGMAGDFGGDGLPQFEQPLTKANVEIVGQKLYPQGTTDLTNEMLAVKGSDVIVNWGYPQEIGLSLKTAAQHGLDDVPMVTPASGALVNSMKLVEASLQANLYSVMTCDPTSDARPYVQEWANRYQETYDAVADYASATSYDAVGLVIAAADESGSSDSAGIAKSLKTVTYNANTMCATEYHADERQELMHEAVLVNFAGGKPAVVAAYTAADLLGHGANQG